MKLTKLGKAAKETGCLALYKIADDDEQWAGINTAAYSLAGIPHMETARDLATICEIPTDTMDAIRLSERRINRDTGIGGAVSLELTTPDDLPAEELPVRYVVRGTELTALQAKDGSLGFVNKSLLAPIKDRLKSEYISWTWRRGVYIVRDGFDVIAVVMPENVDREELAAQLMDTARRLMVTEDRDD